MYTLVEGLEISVNITLKFYMLVIACLYRSDLFHEAPCTY